MAISVRNRLRINDRVGGGLARVGGDRMKCLRFLDALAC